MSNDIIGRYLQASQGNEDGAQGASMEVDINAFIPSLQQKGRLHALRVISRVGRISYRVLGFQGSNTVKSQVIARYLQAEQKGQNDPKLAITPANYKFRFRGERIDDTGRHVYVFLVVPRTAEFGRFKGEVWLDVSSCLPIYERGRLVKNPSVFFKQIDFERAFSIESGRAVPEHMSSVITTRVVGRVELDINYSNYAQLAEDEGDTESLVPTINLSSN
ncbi:MAG: hypothetical protein M3Y72_22465 [Acidobacteriota bacterium]|nr:hypothetical protein [Acidobacteriota bacterium]